MTERPDVVSRLHNLAVGQVAELLVWTRLVATSGGDLHVFLPLEDRGIDGIVHRISTDGYARVQVKGRSVHRFPGIELKVRRPRLPRSLPPRGERRRCELSRGDRPGGESAQALGAVVRRPGRDGGEAAAADGSSSPGGLLYDIDSRELDGIQVKSVSFPAGAGEAHVSVYRPALRPSPQTWFVVFLADQGATDFLPHCALIPSLAMPGYLGGHGTEGGLAVTRHLTGRLAVARSACLAR